MNEDGNDNNPFRYSGEYTDGETGMIYLRARYYDPGLGRFISEDPIKDGMNWYVYCNGNPVNRWDPSGLSDLDDIKDARDNGIIIKTQKGKAAVISNGVTSNYTIRNFGDSDSYEFIQNGEVAGNILKVPTAKQPNTLMCTPTSGAMIDSFYQQETNRNSLSIAQSVFGSTNEQDYNQGMRPTLMNGHVDYTLKEIEDIIFYDISFKENSTIKEEINNGNPLIAGLRLTDSDSHAIVISGYLSINNTKHVIYNEPGDGSKNIIKYIDFINGMIPNPLSNANWMWTYTTKKNN